MRNKFALLALGLLTACGPLVSIGESGPAPQRFALSLTETSAPPQQALPTIRVEELDAPAELANARMAVRVGTQEVRYVTGGVWTDRPARMLRALLADALRARSSGLILSGTQNDVAPAYRLTGRLIAFQADAPGGVATQVQVRSEQLLIATKSGQVMASNRFAASAAASSDRPADLAAAANKAANALALETADWVRAQLTK